MWVDPAPYDAHSAASSSFASRHYVPDRDLSPSQSHPGISPMTMTTLHLQVYGYPGPFNSRMMRKMQLGSQGLMNASWGQQMFQTPPPPVQTATTDV
ncbi:hypothetical protein AKJ16_DCAP12059 [Drosera capensis]